MRRLTGLVCVFVGSSMLSGACADHPTPGVERETPKLDASSADTATGMSSDCPYVAVPAGARKLGLDVLDVNEGEQFDDNLARADELHASYLFWIEYARFLASIRAYVSSKYPGLQVGFTATLDGFVDADRKTPDGWPMREAMQAWAMQVDVVGITYYPLNADFTMQAPEVVVAQLAALVASVPDEKPIHVQELGYASGALVSSSEAAQARFFCEALHAWDLHVARIPRLAVLRLNDATEAKARALAGPYGVSTPAFIEYLRTLGLRSATGAAKPAYALLQEQAELRGL